MLKGTIKSRCFRQKVQVFNFETVFQAFCYFFLSRKQFHGIGSVTEFPHTSRIMGPTYQRYVNMWSLKSLFFFKIWILKIELQTFWAINENTVMKRLVSCIRSEGRIIFLTYTHYFNVAVVWIWSLYSIFMSQPVHNILTLVLTLVWFYVDLLVFMLKYKFIYNCIKWQRFLLDKLTLSSENNLNLFLPDQTKIFNRPAPW